MRKIEKKDFLTIIIVLLVCAYVFLILMVAIPFDQEDCVVVKGTWLKQELRPDCEGCLHYSFIVQDKVFNYFAQNEFLLRDDLDFGDDIKIKLCWDDRVNGFLTKGIEKYE